MFVGCKDDNTEENDLTSEDVPDNISIASIDSNEEIHSRFFPLADSERQKLCKELHIKWFGPVRHTHVGGRLLGPPSRIKVI